MPGPAQVTATSGNWLVYSAGPSGDTFGGLDSANTAIWDTAAGGAVSASGNRYVFAYQPFLTVTTTDGSKIYGTNGAGSVATDYIVTGLQAGVAGAYLGDTAATAYSGMPSVTSAGSAAGAGVIPGGYAYSLGLGTLTSKTGYGFILVNTGRLTVKQGPVLISANTIIPDFAEGAPGAPSDSVPGAPGAPDANHGDAGTEAIAALGDPRFDTAVVCLGGHCFEVPD